MQKAQSQRELPGKAASEEHPLTDHRVDAMIRVPYDEIQDTLRRVLVREGFADPDADLCARLFADASQDGVPSHGLNRFMTFVRSVRAGIVDPRGTPTRVAAFGALERWDGHSGPGPLNAHRSMERAIELAREHGIGCVALANTNHWMRAGNYGWQAADAGVIGICWTNTLPNLPPWGATRPRTGNNPLVLAVPRPPDHVVLDMAMSQFAYGTLDVYRRRGERLPVPGGFDASGEMTDDPATILATGRVLPVGFWKGSGLALLLDLVAALLSGGRATHQIPPEPHLESGLSQVFIAIDPAGLPGQATSPDEFVNAVLAAFQSDDEEVRYPGARAVRARREAATEGVAVDDDVWSEILAELQ